MTLQKTQNLTNASSMTTGVMKSGVHDVSAETLEKLIVQGDLKTLTPPQRIEYYRRTCESLGLNHLTRPFEYVSLNGKLVFYARKDATEQLRAVKKISITKIDTKRESDIYIVTAHAQSADGRTDIATGAVSIKGLNGDQLANAFMKAETKAKRRVTLSLAGLGFIDESEISSVQGAKIVHIDAETGEIKEEEGQPSVEDILNKLKEAKTIDGLASEFKKAVSTSYISDPSFKEKLIKIKDERKTALESQNEWIVEYSAKEAQGENNNE